MRPLKIVFEGFETYCNKTEIDFTLLGRSGIYLITGKTGSGKTTIFDGICYALYGEASGTDRSEKMLRSVNADGNTPTYVDFTFENNGKIYNIRRNPEYMRKAKKGDSEAKEKSDAVLTLPDGKVISQQKNVNPAVVEILGLDKEQFVQIAMIAQGKFQKLLFSETKDRIELFRKIFKTELYELLQKRLRDDVIALNKKCRDIKLSISQYVSGIQCEEENPQIVNVNKAKNGELPVEEICTVIEKLIQDGKAEKETLEKENRTVQKKLEEVKAELKKAEDFLNQQKLCEEKKEQLVQKEGQLKNLEAELKKEEEACAAVPKQEEELALKKEKLSAYDELEEEKAAFEKLTETLRKETAAETRLKNQLAFLKEETKKLKEEEAALSSTGEEYQKIENSISTLTAGIKQIVSIMNADVEAKKAASDFERASSVYKKSRTLYENAESEYKQKYLLFLDGQAGILAKELEEGKPCPVCGSLAHPKPAACVQSAPSQEELNELEAKVELAKKDSEEKSSASSAAAAVAEEKKNVLLKSFTDYFGEGSALDIALVNQTRARLMEEKASCENKKAALKKSAARKEEIAKVLPEKIRETEKLEEETAACGGRIIKARATSEEKEKQICALKAKLEFDGKGEAEKNISALAENIEKKKLALKKVQETVAETKNGISLLKGTVTALEDSLKGFDGKETEKLSEEYNELCVQNSSLIQKINTAFSALEKNADALKNINRRREELSKLEEEYSWKEALDKTANGDLGNGKEKIKLETYVQMRFFDRIIERSNLRLFKMTDGQYELVRSGGLDKRQQSGLELDVKDYYKGGQRSVKSLSGGEQFQASLSLALGLSDEIQSNAGGIELDSMFIDEGFGSLDSETLEKAMKALMNLAEGNKLVGIISHVSELKQKIDRQIVVEKNETAGSSCVKVVV